MGAQNHKKWADFASSNTIKDKLNLCHSMKVFNFLYPIGSHSHPLLEVPKLELKIWGKNSADFFVQ